MSLHEKKVAKLRSEKTVSKIKNCPETEKEFLEILNFYAHLTKNLVAQELGYTTGWAGVVQYGTKINEEDVKMAIQSCPTFKILSIYLTILEKLKIGPHPEDGEDNFRQWFEKTARKYNSSVTYHKLFGLARRCSELEEIKI